VEPDLDAEPEIEPDLVPHLHLVPEPDPDSKPDPDAEPNGLPDAEPDTETDLELYEVPDLAFATLLCSIDKWSAVPLTLLTSVEENIDH
jgi:hypothetical protein